MDILGLVDLPLWLVLILCCIGSYLIYMMANFGTFWKLGIPGPIPIPILGVSVSVLKKGFLESTVDMYVQNKKHKIYGIYEARTPVMLICDLDIAYEMLVKQSSNFLNRRQYHVLNQPGIDNLMFNTRGQKWKESRSLMRASITSARVKLMYPTVETLLKKLVCVLREKAMKHGEIDVSDPVACFAMDFIARTAFNTECDSLMNPNHEFVHSVKDVLAGLDNIYVIQNFLPPFIKTIMDFFGMTFLPVKKLQILRGFLETALQERQRNPNADSKTIVSYMLDHSVYATPPPKGKLMNMTEMLGFSVTYFLAGYDTMAKATYYTLYQMAMNPDCFKSAQEEVDAKLGGEFPNLENIRKLKYLDQCLKESTRIIPLAFYVERECEKETVINGYRIPTGMVCRVPYAGYQMDPEVYPNPAKFNPDRFSPENAKNRHPLSLLTFGTGPRSCFGEPVAQPVMLCTLAALLQEFDMVPCKKSEYPVRIHPMSDATAMHLLYLSVTPRK